MTSRLVRLAAGLLMFAVLMGPGAAPTTAAISAGGWQVVLAAGDDAEPVFDNATRELGQRLAAAGVLASNIHRLSATAAELPARMSDRCLVFLTSHGERGAGLWLARSNTALSPDELARALSRGCAAVPTVVVVSACYSGGFVAGKMAKPNRIILTAARRDRPSFGCQVRRSYNFFDECLLGAL